MTFNAGLERNSPPHVNAKMIRRHSIIEQMNNLSKRAILYIHTPAGYGKTTAAALWSRNKNVIWLSLDEYSSSSSDVYRRLLLALSYDVFKEFYSSPLEYTLDALQEIKTWPDAIIIDDFHLCLELSLARALPLIRHRMPVSTSLIILSRNHLPKILEEQVMKGTLNKITDLRFTSNEIISLFGKNKISVSKYDADILLKQTDGWVAVLAAILMSHGSGFTGTFNKKTLNQYLRSTVFENEDSFNILKMCSICDTLNPSLCETITGQSGAWDTILALANKTGLVSCFDENTYRFHNLLRDFLFSELQLDERIDKPSLYKTAAYWYEANGSILSAVVLAANSGDIPLIEYYMRLSITEYGRFDLDLTEQVSTIIKKVYSKIPHYIAKQSLSISLAFFSIFYNAGRLQEALEWLDIAKGLLAVNKYPPDTIIRASVLFALDPRVKIKDIIFSSIIPVLTSSHTGTKTVMVFSTLNLPFFHKAHIDFSGISPHLDGILSKAMKLVLQFMYPALKLSLLLIEAGTRYECGEFDKAEKIAEEATQISGQFPPHMQFCLLILCSEISGVQGKAFDPVSIDKMISEAKAHYLYPNFNAYTTNRQLQTGNMAAAATWLAHSDVELTLTLSKIYQYFTTARSLIVTGKLSEAEKLLDRLVVFSQNYRRSSDVIEALTLQAICKWHMKRADDALDTIIQAIIKASELHLIMPISKEGHDIIPILMKVLNRLRYGYDADKLDKAFVNNLFLKARSISQYSQGMLTEKKNGSVKLSRRQKEILIYLSQNLTYREISDKFGVTVATVNDHIHKIYGKLEVTNAHDAVMKASELGIVIK